MADIWWKAHPYDLPCIAGLDGGHVHGCGVRVVISKTWPQRP